MQVYVNGTASGSSCLFSGSLDTNNEDVVIADYQYGSDRDFNGSIDNVRIYDMNISATQIYENYDNGYPLYDTIVSDETSESEIWTVSVTPADGYDLGTELKANLTIKGPEPPNVSLQLPFNGYINYTSDRINITFSCNATDNIGLKNISLYITNSSNQTLAFNQSADISGNSNSSSWILELELGDYTWNCLAYDVEEKFDWGENYSLRITQEDVYHIFYGNATGLIQLGRADDILYEFGDGKAMNIFVTDYDSNVNWLDLQAIGLKTDNSTADIDFDEIDAALNLTGYPTGISNSYSGDGSTALVNKTFTVYYETIGDVPIVNSTNSSTFVTGLLWDTSDSTDDEYNLTEKEDLVFVTEGKNKQQGKYGIYDYEIKIPETLNSYKGSNEMVSFYLELV
jgi:hypothetical protein